MTAHVAAHRSRWQAQKRIYFSLTRGSDAFIAAEMKQDHAEKSRSGGECTGYPLRSLEEFAQLLMKHRLMDECAWFDPEGYDGGATLERLSRAFQEATDKEEQRWWRVDWCGEDGKLCRVSAHTAEDAERKAAAYFSFYPPSTVYSVVEVVERKTTVKRFMASSATGEVSDTDTTGGIEAK